MEKNLQTIMQAIQNYQPYNEQEENDRRVMLKLLEAQEETGVSSLKVLSDDIFSLEILTVDGHVKRGSYVPSHLHLNVTYLFEADEEEVLRIKPDENSGVKWFSFAEALEKCSESWMVRWVYSKLMHKLEKLDHERGI